ncbi:hypothetical protein Slin15195_G076820 [Septoria linicola]|uniref:Uncharacterized protein n=1 Tax=Septoria linicola TaxID=215465 RepID=A0A9Q9EME6_9PEZI|nr:hypothetical protein Slin14017_G037970 [Septoria linicola]USW54363.1 hypothetical protein Slin15195_G076820 [Septoria linicola]
MFDPRQGGSYEVFNIRPLPQILVDYCIGDVQLLPTLQTVYSKRFGDVWWERVEIESNRRLNEAMKADYKPQGKHKIFAPKKWKYLPIGHAHLRMKKRSSTAHVQNIPLLPAAMIPSSSKDPVSPRPGPSNRNDSGSERLRDKPVVLRRRRQ